ncbi:hypothetical protein [Maridesulfovibrio sp.]|uniref:hypothetical protein n=1 Tax=unclassified Maridesulfovibrio TaxID=2794999 RepID=UPI003AFFF27F
MNIAKELWVSFKNIYGPVLTFGGIAISWGAWGYSANTEVSVKFIVPLFLLVFIVLFTVFNAYLSSAYP